MNMKRIRTIVPAAAAILLIIAVGPTPTAQAQIIAPREAAQIQLGSLSIYPSVRLIDVGMDQNVYNDPSDPTEDFTFTVASKAVAVLRLGLNELMFSTGSDYVWFKEQASERATNAAYAVRFNLSASRFKPFIGAERIRTRSRPNVEIDARALRLDQMLVAGTNFNLSERTALSATLRYTDSTFDDGEQFRGVRLADPLNRRSPMYSAGVRYAITPLTTFVVTGNYVEERFRNSPLRNSRSYSVTPGFEFSPEAAIRGTFSAGYQLFSPENPEFADHQGFVMEGSLNWSILGRTTFDAGLRRNVNYSYQDTEPMYLQTGARLVVTQRLFGPIGIQGSAERQFLSYRWRHGASPAPGTEPREDTSDVYGGGVLVDLGRGFSVLLGAEQARRHSVVDPRQNFNRTRLLSNITIGQ
jgi:hypothetical protein